MAAPNFINAATVLEDTTADASPISTSSYNVTSSGHTLIVSVDHERGSATDASVLSISSITRNGQSFSRVKRHTVTAGAASEVGDVWQLQNADVGDYPLSITYTGTGGSDISVIVLEYDGGVADPDLAEANYLLSADAAIATVDVDCPADSRLIIVHILNNGGGVWGSPSHGTAREDAKNASGTSGNMQTVADYEVTSAGTVSGVHVAFSPYLGWSNGANMVIAFPLEAVVASEITPAPLVSANVMGSPSVDSDGLVSPAPLMSANVMGSPALTTVWLEPDDEDGDSYHTTNTYVSGNTLYVTGHDNGSGFTGWDNFNCRLSGGVPGATITVVVDASTKRTEPGAPLGNNNTTGSPWTPSVRARIDGEWGEPFKLSDYAYNGTTKAITGTFVWPDDAEEVQVAYKTSLRVDEIQARMAALLAGTYASEPPSSIAATTLPAGVHARLNYGAGANSVGSGTLDYPCVALGSGPHKGVVILTTHPQEEQGDRACFRFLNWIVGASDEAAEFRSIFTVYVYPHNLSGRRTGQARLTADTGGDEDANRAWNVTTSDQTQALKAAIETHDAPDMAFLFDFHGIAYHNVTSEWMSVYYRSESAGSTEFSSRIVAALTGVSRSVSSTSGTSQEYGAITRGAPVASTIEIADAAPGYPDDAAMYDAAMATIGETLLDMAIEGYFGAIPVTPATLVSANVMGAPALTTKQTLTPTTLVSANVMGVPSISAAGSVSPAALVSANAMGTPALTTKQSVTPAAMASANVMGSPSIATAGAVVPAAMVSIGVMGAPALTTKQSVTPTSMTSDGVMGGASVTTGSRVTPAGFVSQNVANSPTLTTKQSVIPQFMASENVVVGPYFRPPGGNRPPTRRRMNAGTWNRSIAA